MIDQKTAVSSSPTCPDGSAFLNWSEEGHESEHETAVVFRSLVATLKMQPALDVSLEVKAVKFLESVNHDDEESADAFLGSLGRASDESSTEFLQSIRVLFSSTNLVMTTAAMKMLESLILYCSAKVRLAIVNAGFLSQLIMTLNPQSLSLVETGDLHLYLLTIIRKSLWLTDPIFLAALEIQDDNEQQAVHEMVLKQVLSPSEKYISHLCVNRFSIINENLSKSFMALLAQLLEISPYHQRTMNFIFDMPVVLTIPSCLTFFEYDVSIWLFLYHLNDVQLEWNRTSGEERQMSKTVHRMLRMEGNEDVIEEKLQTDKNTLYGGWLVANSIRWNILLGMNVPGRR